MTFGNRPSALRSWCASTSAADGTAKVELAKPTPNPRLNRILLDSLGKWRFMPAIRNGEPVASIEEIVVKVVVK